MAPATLSQISLTRFCTNGYQFFSTPLIQCNTIKESESMYSHSCNLNNSQHSFSLARIATPTSELSVSEWVLLLSLSQLGHSGNSHPGYYTKATYALDEASLQGSDTTNLPFSKETLSSNCDCTTVMD